MTNSIRLFALFLIVFTISECALADYNLHDVDYKQDDVDAIDFPWPWKKKQTTILPNPNEFETPTTYNYDFTEGPATTDPPSNSKDPNKKKNFGLNSAQIVLIIIIALVLASSLTYYIMYLRKKQLTSNFQQI